MYLYEVGVRLSVRHLDGGNLGLSERREVLLVGEEAWEEEASSLPACHNGACWPSQFSIKNRQIRGTFYVLDAKICRGGSTSFIRENGLEMLSLNKQPTSYPL